MSWIGTAVPIGSIHLSATLCGRPRSSGLVETDLTLLNGAVVVASFDGPPTSADDQEVG